MQLGSSGAMHVVKKPAAPAIRTQKKKIKKAKETAKKKKKKKSLVQKIIVFLTFIKDLNFFDKLSAQE